MAKHFTPFRISDNIRETPEGYLFCLGVPIARTGWQKYGPGETPLDVGDDGFVHVYRSKDEVFRPETVASFQGKPITIRHPQDFVKPANWQALARGTAQNVRPGVSEDEDGEWPLLADLHVTEAMAIQLVRNGLREISCGYEAEYEQTDDGKGRQYNIIGNHIALVEDGRAGSTYAIKDHKGKADDTMKKSFIEKLKLRFGAKVIDEVVAEELGKTTDAEEGEKEDKKDDKAKDAGAYDELVKAVKDLGSKVDAMQKGKDEDKKELPKKDDAKKDDAKKDDEKSEDDDSMESSMEERLKVLEAAVQKILEKMEPAAEDESEEGEEEESEDEEGEESSTMTGDTASRVEILAPGLKRVKGEDEQKFKVRAIDAAYATKDGASVINHFTGGKKPTLDSTEKVNMIFIAASEILKSSRGSGLEDTKNPSQFKVKDGQVEMGAITPEKQNEINQAHWASLK